MIKITHLHEFIIHTYSHLHTGHFMILFRTMRYKTNYYEDKNNKLNLMLNFSYNAKKNEIVN